MLYGSAGSSAAWSGVDGANAKLMDPDSNSPVLMDVIIFKECAPTSAVIRPLEDFLSRFQKKKIIIIIATIKKKKLSRIDRVVCAI